MSKRLNIDEPRYDQTTFEGRAKHFFATTNPLNVLATDDELDTAKKIVTEYRAGTADKSLGEEQVWAAKELYDSAFHPQTGERVFIFGRMSFQVPGNMLITGFMLTFYKSTPAVIFWQVANQSFNAVVNYANRNASVGVSNEQLGTAYVGATTAGVLTALGFNKLIAASPSLSAGIVGRLVPLIAVAAANCVNIPLMRQEEVKNGITVSTEDGQEVGPSTAAAVSALQQVIPSRIGMAIPGMFIPPVLMTKLEKTAMFIKNPWLKLPATLLLTGACLTFSTPLCCALFPQKAAIQLSELEPAMQKVQHIPPTTYHISHIIYHIPHTIYT
ncbi:sideroflexin1like protein putative [Ochromonadaceae sp. CCMP2298]|nr:sideroflexin1like protein putative [Ochromonadaceae sp. CCMP2298]